MITIGTGIDIVSQCNHKMRHHMTILTYDGTSDIFLGSHAACKAECKVAKRGYLGERWVGGVEAPVIVNMDRQPNFGHVSIGVLQQP